MGMTSSGTGGPHATGPFRALDSWWLDVKLGVRMLARYPGLALAGGAGIAVAVALAVATFSVVYGAFLVSSLPLDEGDRIVSIETWDAAAQSPEPRILHDYQVWRQALTSVQEVSAFSVLNPNLIAPDTRPESVRVAAMSASGFRVARVQPLMGRYLQEDDEREGAPSVVVIGEDIWRSRFGGDPAVLERTIQFGSVPHAVVGVMPKGFAFPFNDRFWVPLRLGVASAEPLTGPALMVFGRLAPGATLARAQAELAGISQRTAQAFPTLYTPLRPQVLPYAHPFVGLRGSGDVAGLITMQAVLVSLLALVCLNVAILVYTRTAMRQAEIGVRSALGASRGRIVIQLFIEALVLSVAAALAGVAIAALALRQFGIAVAPLGAALPFWVSFQLSPGAVLYAVALSVFAAALVGIVPALRATRRGLRTGLAVAGTDAIQLGRTWTVLIVAQVAFAVALLPPALSGAWKSTHESMAGLGFAADEFLSAQLGMDVDIGATTAPGTRAFTDRFAARQTELMRRLEADPRVASVTFAMSTPGDERGARIEGEGRAFLSSHSGDVRFNRVDVDFFRVFDVPILAGRGFEPGDVNLDRGIQSGAVVVNQPLAQQMFGGNALGQRIRYAEGSGNPAAPGAEAGRWYEIVGIVSDFPTGVSPTMRDTNRMKVYHAVAAGQVQPAAIAIRMRAAPSTFTPRLQEIAGAVDPDLHLRDIRGLDDVMRREQWISRLTATAVVAVTVSVLMLSSAGIYALMSFTVSRRRREIGIRMALGAGQRQIVASVFTRALVQLAAGAALGLAFGVAIDRGSAGVVMQGNAATVLPGVTLVIVAVGIMAALGPTRRSLRIEPTEALRVE